MRMRLNQAAIGLAFAIAGCGGGPTPEPGGGFDPAPNEQQVGEPGPAVTKAVPAKKPAIKREAAALFEAAIQAYAPKGQKHDFGRAISLLEEAIDADASFGEAYLNIGLMYEEQGKLEEAGSWFKKASEKGKKYGAGYANFGRLKLLAGRKAEAMSWFQKALGIDPFCGEAHLHLAIQAKDRRDFASAVKHVRTALKEDSQNVAAYEVLARVYYDLGRIELAKLVCETGLEIDADAAGLHNVLGLVHLKLDDVTQATRSFEAAIKADPKHSAALMNFGAITFSYRDYEASYRAFDTVVRLEPKNVEAIISRAVAARGLDRLPEAEQGYKKALEVNRCHVGAHFNLGLLYQEYMQKLPEALKSYEQVLRCESKDAAVRKDVTQRIQTVRIQIETLKEAEEMMKEEQKQDGKG
jgi:tetratricopeptide (TPR) repeat protein